MTESVKSVRSIRLSQHEFDVELACGIVVDGKVVRKLRGRSVITADKKVFGDPRAKDNAPKIITNLLFSKFFSSPDIPRLASRHFQSEMLRYDRDQLILELRKATVGDKPFHEQFTCRSCGTENEVTIEADEVFSSFTPMSDEERLTITNGKCTYKIELPEWEFYAVMAHPDGRSQEDLATRAEINPFLLDLHMIKTFCVDFNGEGPINSLDDIGDLDPEFLQAFEAEMSKRDYGYNTAVSCSCASCGKHTQVLVNPLDFLFPSVRTDSST